MSLEQLKAKWLPYLQGKKIINDLALRLYRADVKRYKQNNPQWRNTIA